MKKLILVVAVAITVFAGVAVNSPADTVVGAPEPSPNTELSELGPVDLIMASYTATETVSCNQSDEADDESRCAETISLGSFDTTGASVTSCTGTNNFSIEFDEPNEDCGLNGGGSLSFKVDVLHDLSDNETPCAGAAFATVVITNGVGDTLTLTITSLNGNAPCSN